MAIEKKVAYCGGKWENCEWKTPRKSNVSNILNAWSANTEQPPISAKNETDADAYIFAKKTDDYGHTIEVKLHVFKTCCSPKMMCTYNSGNSVTIINQNQDIWQKLINNGNVRVMADYNSFNNTNEKNNYRIESSYASGEEGFNVEFWFRNVENDDIPTATTIGANEEGMFQGCTDLVTCNVPCQMRFISKNTFKGCTSLTSYSENPDFVDTIGESAFENCSGMQTIVIGKNAVISGRSFANCSGADTIEWHNTKEIDDKCRMTDIPEGAFTNCTSLCYTKFSGDSSAQDAVIIPRGISGISSNAFSNCSNIKNLKMYDVTEIGDYAFSECTSLSGVSGMSGVTKVGERAFYNLNSGLTVHTMGDLSQMYKIGSFAFCNVNFDDDINLSSCTTIGDYAFASATLSGVTINLAHDSCPPSVALIPSNCFQSASIYGELTINCYDIGPSAFQYTNFVNYGNVDLSNVTNSIGSYAFQYSNIVGVTLGSVSVSWYAFANCSALTSVTFSGNASVGTFAFYSDSYLKNIYIGSGVTVSRDSTSFTTAPTVHLDYDSQSSTSYPGWVTHYEWNGWEDCQIVDRNDVCLYRC